MMAASPLIIGAAQRDDLRRLRDFAAANPIDVLAVIEQCKSKQGHREHLDRMKSYTIPIPTAFAVTYSVETGHPGGTARHMSMSSVRNKRTPTPEAVWMIAEELGFAGSLEQCTFWQEDIGAGDVAINVAQPVSVQAERST